jgi:asparagine synthase (glutamine-hydrolysing)
MTFIAGVLRRDGDALNVCEHMLRWAIQEPNLRRVSDPAPDIALGISFHAVLPEDIYDEQPLADDRYALVGDVRIDNRQEVCSKLDLESEYAAKLADSDIFLSCWRKWQLDCVSHLIGGFAVAVWDKQERELFLVRDHCGERPVYYASDASTFGFASLPHALRQIPHLDTRPNEQMLLHYLAVGPDSSHESYFNNVFLLQPGHRLRYRQGHIAVQRYWHPADTSPTILKTDDDYVAAVLERFDASVQSRLRTNGAVGSQLSGGMDSSSVTAAAATLLGSTRLTAFTAIPHASFTDVNPTGRFGNEGPAAQAVAAMYPNIDHVFVEPSGDDMMSVIEKTGRLTGAPVFNPMNQMWFNAILDKARSRGINVMLQGACGNATISFGGLIGLSELFRSRRWLTLARQVFSLRARGHTSWRGAAYWATSYAIPSWMRRFLDPQMRGFDFAYSPVHPKQDQKHRLRELAFTSFFASESSAETFRRKIFDFYDVGCANAGVSLGWGISLRDPMQDKRVFEFCLSIPVEQYLVGGQSRSLVRRAMRDRLPREVLACTTRGLQSADWYLTMGSRRKEMAEELRRIAQSHLARELLDLDRLQHLLDTWPASGYERAEVSDSWHLALSRGLACGMFIRQFEG